MISAIVKIILAVTGSHYLKIDPHEFMSVLNSVEVLGITVIGTHGRRTRTCALHSLGHGFC